MKLRVRRIYDTSNDHDGTRILVDRLWPRGISKEKARLDFWAKDCAPSNELRKWYDHDPEKWDEFRQRYFAELKASEEAVEELRGHLGDGVTTLLFSSKETERNNAMALKDFLEIRSR